MESHLSPLDHLPKGFSYQQLLELLLPQKKGAHAELDIDTPQVGEI